MSITKKVEEYFVALIIGVIYLKILYEIVLSVFSSMPLIARYGIMIIFAAVTALVAIAKKGIS